MRLVILSRSPLLRAGILSVVRESSPDLELIESGSSGRVAVELARADAVDLAVVDSLLDELNGPDTVRQMLRARPDASMVLLVRDPQPASVTEAVEAGARAVLDVDCAAEDLRRALGRLHEDAPYLCPVCTGSLVEVAINPDVVEEEPILAALTPREREVLQLIAEGLSSRDAAARLHISPKTVDTHRRHIMKKLDADSVAELVRSAIRAGLIAA